MDSDKEALKQRQRYEAKFGALVDERIFSLTDCVKAFEGPAIEALLHPDDRLTIQKTVYPEATEYEKKVFHRAVQELVQINRHPQISDETGLRFRQVLEFLEGKLAVFAGPAA